MIQSHTGEPLIFSGEPGDALKLSGGVGTHYVEGTIEVKEKGAVKKKPWKFNYSVGAPTATVANADLAVLYKGWDNKLKISASGYDPESVKISCSGCTISKKGEFYIAKPGNGKVATISVSATSDDGQNVKLAAEEFRIFPLPLPKPYFANQTFDKPTMKKGTAISASQVLAKLGDSPLNVKYTVTGFKMIVTKGGKIAELKAKNGKAYWRHEKAAIKKMPKGTSLTFVGVSAAGPSGKSAANWRIVLQVNLITKTIWYVKMYENNRFATGIFYWLSQQLDWLNFLVQGCPPQVFWMGFMCKNIYQLKELFNTHICEKLMLCGPSVFGEQLIYVKRLIIHCTIQKSLWRTVCRCSMLSDMEFWKRVV